ncbi:unnamed protein product [Rotaria sp. Silwood1]|nr:unnamed protein product [Rotaria sp. Silwood1]CAF1489931.1 unnamed protein product [Rotaria sp. Silwood1]CAF3596491.1 unnamed protein product [Rotaria sp. Silwood1]CAF3622872.1 unnamed protein product [Rotaria sp. Silwood1]CAF4847325.1 unnamed protein product [Rotaria sp. Silwood1]
MMFWLTDTSSIQSLTEEQQKQILEEVELCFEEDRTYTDNLNLVSVSEKEKINTLLTSWQLNKKLRSFLKIIETNLSLVKLQEFKIRLNIIGQQFTVERNENHHKILLKSTILPIDSQRLIKAQQRYFKSYSNQLIKSIKSLENCNQSKEFPEELFLSTNNENNSLSSIMNYFKNNLKVSWKQFQTAKEILIESNAAQDEISKLLVLFRQESTEFWAELIQSIKSFNELLFKTGLVLRITPTILINLLHQLWLNEEHQEQSVDELSSTKRSKKEQPCELILTKEQCALLGGTIVDWIIEQHIERALYFACHQRWEEFKMELSNTPHTNWIPAEHLPWLILELEMNITIREIQIKVVRHMMEPPTSADDKIAKNIVMQMNMGEGKTSVIIPMLALSLCSSSSSLVRVVVLKALLTINYQSLRSKLGGLLNRKIFPFFCRRDMNFNLTQINTIFQRFQQALIKRDVIITAPEYILSFDLLTIDKCRRQELELGKSMLNIQRWSKKYARDVLDESDEILHVKYQLIYTVGGQLQVDGGIERWKTIQSILHSVKQHAASIAESYENDVCYKASTKSSHFPEFRLLSERPFLKLCENIANDWLNNKDYRQIDKELILSFILKANVSFNTLQHKFSTHVIQQFLILRGLLSAEVLYFALKKRYRVNFGVNESSTFRRLMAVPFRAKDVAAENTEFGHPDLAIILTQLSYYYSGLTALQIDQCLDRLNQHEREPELIYEKWISNEDKKTIDSSIRHWKGINLRDSQQKKHHLHPVLRYNMVVIDYFLDHFVYPQEAKQFPHKLVASAWDLSASSRTKIVTGFSGTNDTQLLLPVHIRQCDLPELQKTDAIVLNNLLQLENENYQSLTINTNSYEILNQIFGSKSIINVIIDVGALFIDGSNRQIAVKWLELSDKSKIDYAIYFEMDSIFVYNRQGQHHPFQASPANERLDRCVVYLDESHTRGTDFKFPNDFRAAVTLGNGLTKDRFVQGCMRMRKLGKYHWLTFWSSHEVDQQIRTLKRATSDKSQDDMIHVIDIIRWVYDNTQQATWDGLHHWSTQSLSYQQKVNAFRHVQWTNNEQQFTANLLHEIAKHCLEPEVISLEKMYGPQKLLQTIEEIYSTRSKQLSLYLNDEIHKAVLKRLKDYGGSKKILASSSDEEQQRELQREIEQQIEEERQHQRPIAVSPQKPKLHDEIKQLCSADGPMLHLESLTEVFRRLPFAFNGSTFSQDCQSSSWQKNIWISTEFQKVIRTLGESLDPFLRPPRWIVVYRNQHIIFVSAFEANWLIKQLKTEFYSNKIDQSYTTTLRLLLPRIKNDQSILVNQPTLTIPPSIVSDGISHFIIPNEWLVELLIFNGTLYFETADEQEAYCQCLGVCPKPRTKIEKDAFEKGWILVDGFIAQEDHRQLLHRHRCRFTANPLRFIQKLIENRTGSHAPRTSHVGSIIFDTTKILS